jgi:pimeloyl-ACP methyl ester carboxylesterase
VDRPDVHYARAADGASIAYQAFGAGRYDIVFMSGNITNLDVLWESAQEVEWFQRLAGLGRVVMLDRRGMGLSDPVLKPPSAPGSRG